MQPIEIFRIGTHTAMSGQTLEFSRDLLSDAVSAYQADLHEAPIVIGHPKDNHPAFGWIDHLELTDDGIVLAHPKQVDSDFAELVKEGRYKKRSASWYSPDSPANPTPGKLYLRHVGFLGAMPPALKGLGDVQFNEAEEGVLEFAESPYLWTTIGNAFRALREWVIGKDGVETADKIISNYQIDDMVAETERLYQKNREAEVMPSLTNFSENQMTTEKDQEIAQLKQQLADEKAKTVDFSEQTNTLKQREAQLAKREIAAKVDDFVKQGKVLPAQKDGLVEFMSSLDDGAQIIEFGEGDKAVKQSPRQFMTAFLNQQPQWVEFKELTPSDGIETLQDLSPTELAAKISQYHQKQNAAGHTISFSEAAAAVQAGKE